MLACPFCLWFANCNILLEHSGIRFQHCHTFICDCMSFFSSFELCHVKHNISCSISMLFNQRMRVRAIIVPCASFFPFLPYALIQS